MAVLTRILKYPLLSLVLYPTISCILNRFFKSTRQRRQWLIQLIGLPLQLIKHHLPISRHHLQPHNLRHRNRFYIGADLPFPLHRRTTLRLLHLPRLVFLRRHDFFEHVALRQAFGIFDLVDFVFGPLVLCLLILYPSRIPHNILPRPVLTKITTTLPHEIHRTFMKLLTFTIALADWRFIAAADVVLVGDRGCFSHHDLYLVFG